MSLYRIIPMLMYAAIGGREQFQLTPGQLPDPVNVIFSSRTKLLETCGYICSTYAPCTGFHYDPSTASCDLLNYSYNRSMIDEQITLWFVYLLVIDTTIARGKNAYLSSVYAGINNENNFLASNGNDGIYDKEGLMAHTATNSGDDSPYWFVDLETPCTVYALNFFNRHGGPSVRANNPQVRTGMTEELVTDDPRCYKICAEKEGQIPAVSTLFICKDPVSARYVSFHIYNDAPAALNFYEIELHGVCN